MPRYATIEKAVGETPLEATERLRSKLNIPLSTPLAYAGRLDPMASGKLLILIGEECKRQETYHSLDKEYIFSVLFGVNSDTADILGLVTQCTHVPISTDAITNVAKQLTGPIELPYPHFSSKTVEGKPLHVWTLEHRLDEIEIPIKKSTIYKLNLLDVQDVSFSDLFETALQKIDTVTRVTAESKRLGRDFRRVDVRTAWDALYATQRDHTYQVATFSCIASSGTYMRTLAEYIAKELGTCGLAYSIHRKTIGTYRPLFKSLGVWTKRF